MSIITLTTDFGLKDGNVGVMKGVILGIAPQVQIVDLSHLIQAQDILEAGLILRRSAPFFPAGTIHVVVVDPGVGTQRRPIVGWVGQNSMSVQTMVRSRCWWNMVGLIIGDGIHSPGSTESMAGTGKPCLSWAGHLCSSGCQSG